MNTIDQLIELNNKKSALLQELKQSLEEEAADYVVCKVPPMLNETRFVLVKRDTGKEMCYGTKSEIEKFITRRNINKIYWRTK